MKRILFILALVMSAMGMMAQERIRLFTSERSFIDAYFINETDSSYIVRVTQRYVHQVIATLVNKTDSSDTFKVTNQYIVYEGLRDDDQILEKCLVAYKDSNYRFQHISFETNLEECNDTIYYLKKDFIGGYVCDNPHDGGVSPGQWDAYCAVRKQVHRLAEEKARKKFKKIYGGMGTCHTIWYYEKLIFKEKYNIDWKSPADLNPHIIFD